MLKIKSTIRQIMASVYHATNHFLTRLQGKVLILMYHRVLSEKELNLHFIQPGMYVRNNVFEKQIQFLKEHFRILSFSELLNLWKEEIWDKSKRYCVITFDDGWLDNYIYAYPVLRKYNIPATIFLPTAFIGTHQWFWPDKMSYLLKHYYNINDTQKKKECLTSLLGKYPWLKDLNMKNCPEKIDSVIEMCKELPDDEIHDLIEKMIKALGLEIPDERVLLNWDEIEEMSKNGISFGSHSSTHKILTKLPFNQVQREIKDSLYILQKKKIHYIPVFCYPNGNYTQEIAEQVKAAGYQAAVTTRFGFESDTPNYFALKRIEIHNDVTMSVPMFSFHLSGIAQRIKSTQLIHD